MKTQNSPFPRRVLSAAVQAMTPDLSDIKAAAHGRWPEIHAALGIPRALLDTRKHQSCPYCGGRDRYRYTDHQGNGGYICNQCTPQGGSGFDLIMLVFGCTFTEAVRQTAAQLGMSRLDGRLPPRPQPAQTIAPQRDRQAELAELWQQAAPLNGSDPASAYLHGRGLPPEQMHSARAIRFHPALPYWATRCNDHRSAAPVLLGHYPAMLAAVTAADGSLQGLHKTYLHHTGGRWHKLAATHPDTGEPLPAKKMSSRHTGAFNGAAVRLAAPDSDGRLIVAEGIESALAASALFGLPAAAALSAHGMSVFQWPSETAALYIAADNDDSRTGIKAAHELAVSAIKAGIKAHIWTPEAAGFDPLDELNRRLSDGITQEQNT